MASRAMVLPICPLPMNPTVVMFLVSFQRIRTMSCGGLVVIRVPATGLPSGTWTVDSVHSVASFAVRPIMVGTFRGEFSEIDATLTDGKLIGKRRGCLSANQG
jgi:polyisoprenoid-binding protein YceI